jgi:hypothetical protein
MKSISLLKNPEHTKIPIGVFVTKNDFKETLLNRQYIGIKGYSRAFVGILTGLPFLLCPWGAD